MAPQTFIVSTKFWHKLPNGRIQCDVCPRACKLDEGQKGFCFVRERQDDQVVLTTYGKSSGLAVDPIEKKPLFHFLPGTEILSFGTAGCNLNCQFCQNWNITKSREADILSSPAYPDEIAKAARDRGIPSVAFTYNEPVVFMEYAIDTAKACHEAGIKAVAVTNGYMCGDARGEFYHHMDAANIDLKAFTERFYKTVCGGSLASVLESLIYVKKETKTWLEITTLLIPGENDSEEEIEKLTQWIARNLGPDVPLHFSAFHPDFKMRDFIRTPPATLFRAREVALKNGLHFVYTGNIQDEEGSTTYCANCRQSLLERGGFEITSNRLDKVGRCPACNTICPGVF